MPQFILDNGAVLTMNHAYRFSDFQALHFIRELREGIQAKLLQIFESAGMHRTGIAVRR